MPARVDTIINTICCIRNTYILFYDILFRFLHSFPSLNAVLPVMVEGGGGHRGGCKVLRARGSSEVGNLEAFFPANFSTGEIHNNKYNNYYNIFTVLYRSASSDGFPNKTALSIIKRWVCEGKRRNRLKKNNVPAWNIHIYSPPPRPVTACQNIYYGTTVVQTSLSCVSYITASLNGFWRAKPN